MAQRLSRSQAGQGGVFLRDRQDAQSQRSRDMEFDKMFMTKAHDVRSIGSRNEMEKIP